MTEKYNIPSPTTASQYRRRKKPFLVQASAELTVLMRPIDMADAFFANMIPMPASGVRSKFEEMQKRMESGDMSAVQEMLGETPEESAENMLKFLRRYAVAAVIEPVIVPEDDGVEDHIPVTELTRYELLNIWNAEPSEKEPPVVAPERVEEFRRPESAPDDQPALPREDVRSKAKLVDRGERETISA
jgi:hypothetical protein